MHLLTHGADCVSALCSAQNNPCAGAVARARAACQELPGEAPLCPQPDAAHPTHHLGEAVSHAAHLATCVAGCCACMVLRHVGVGLPVGLPLGLSVSALDTILNPLTLYLTIDAFVSLHIRP